MVSKKPTERATNLSQEYVQESDLDDSGDEYESHLPTNGVAGKETEVDDDEAEEGEEDSPAASEEPQGESVDGDSGEDEGEQDANSALSDSASPSKKRSQSAEEGAGSTAKRQKTNAPGRTSIPGKDFEPPSGFDLSTEKLSDLPNGTQQTFTNLDNKQIWHISAPASLDITSIAQLDLEAALQGEAVTTNDGNSFHMYKTPGNGEMLLLPDSKSKYQRSKASFASVLLQETSSLNNGIHTDETTSPSTTSSGHVFTARVPGQRRPPRQQPQGLTVHNVPVGLHEDTGQTRQRGSNKENEVSAPSVDNEEASEHDDVPSQAKDTPRGSATAKDRSTKKTKGRKDYEDTPPRKEKKKKKRSQLVDAPGL